MTANVNVETGIRFGICHCPPEMFEEIMTNGTDETFEAHKRDCEKQVANLLEELGQRDCDRQAKDIVSNFEWDDYQPEESEYSYEDKAGNKFLISYLGGAPLLWIIKSTKIVHCRSLCSPCVPNGGDLDSGLTTPEDGYECYGVPDDYAWAFELSELGE